jgi:hypothetical protein
MRTLTRRNFLHGLGSAAAIMTLARYGLPAVRPMNSASDRPFEMLVVGDSHISGQGLLPENKTYYLVKEWLERDLFQNSRKVNLMVKAHSGARIDLHPEELEKMTALGDDVNKFHHPEANISQPSIRRQIQVARADYADQCEKVDLIMLSGGITDVLVANTVNPFVKEWVVRQRIEKYCGEAMFSLLGEAAESFPSATLAVVGYFPIISTKSDINRIAKYLFKAVKFPHPLQFTLTNPASRQFLKILRKKMAYRSDLWLRESNRCLENAVASINARHGRPRAIFVRSPITTDNCFGTKRPMLWSTDEDNFPADERYNERKEICPKVFAELKHDHYGKLAVRMCELAAIGHPNLEGARAYAEAVIEKLGPALEMKPDITTRT